MEMKFYKCAHCGKIVAVVKETGVPVFCCEEEMKEIVPGTMDASKEKHVPVYTVENNLVKVKVGELAHPMTEEHHIAWVSLKTKEGNQRKSIPVNKPAEVCFAICDGDEVEEVYAYCNLHGLWKA